ncbi:hypothetical protein SH661x_001804 [Planctomicrobium sp. SH661]|uniref:hypothetical protein n=1 Tax=Planctomicrobium sp. SH661 TaxID=3448124 RepID=UPI003F5BA56B
MSWTPQRKPKALSHTALGMFEKNREEWFLKYLAGTRTPRIPQTDAMCVGAAFDAYVKSALHHDLGFNDPQFELDAIFESQVEEQNRDFGRKAGQHVFDCYQYSGAYADLLALMQQSTEEPRFEFTVEKTINGVPLLGKPDLRFRLPVCVVVGDWKVRGYCSKYSQSPTKNYRLCRDGQAAGKPTKSNGAAHKGYVPMDHHGFEISNLCLSEGSTTYADQMALYAWLLDEPVGDENVAFMMEEIVCKYAGEFQQPLLRVAHHRNRVNGRYQRDLMDRYRACWDAIESGYVFRDMSREENDERCQILDAAASAMSEDDWFTQITRSETRY